MEEPRCWKIVMRSSGYTCYDFMSGLTEEDAMLICIQHDWIFVDEHGFVWDLDICFDPVQVAV